MRCYICNKILEPQEIKQDKYGTFEPCSACKTEVRETLNEYDCEEAFSFGDYRCHVTESS